MGDLNGVADSISGYSDCDLDKGKSLIATSTSDSDESVDLTLKTLCSNSEGDSEVRNSSSESTLKSTSSGSVKTMCIPGSIYNGSFHSLEFYAGVLLYAILHPLLLIT